jgi:hypothetical protein
LCDILEYASAQTRGLLAMTRKFSFPIWKLIVVSSGLEAIKLANIIHEKYQEIWKKEKYIAGFREARCSSAGKGKN